VSREQENPILAGVKRRGRKAAKPSANGPPSGPAVPPGAGPDLHRTDTGNARRFARRHGAVLRYCGPWEKWLVNEDGRRWQLDLTQRVKELAKETALAMFDDAGRRVAEARRQLRALAEAGGDEEAEGRLGAELAEARRDQAFALKSEAAARVRAMIDLAQGEPGLPIVHQHLDAHPMLLNVENGTIDLRTGELRQHRREDLLTAMAPVAYDEFATCPTWEGMLRTVFAGNEDTIRYVQKLLGYALAGDVREQLLMVCWGTGANGKSTLINTFMGMLGEDYAIKAGRDLFMARKQDNHPAQLARLFGKRLVVAVETHEGAKLDEALVKELTGGDPICARRMCENPWQFDPTHKAFLVTNHKPTITGTDHGMWRRIRLLPFAVRIADEDQDKKLPEKLKAEWPGILGWCLAGCLAWQREGLEAPEEVKAATSAYRDCQDVLGAFISEVCLEHSELKVRCNALYAAYRKWAECAGEGSVTLRRFGEALKERGYESYVSNGTWYKGLGLRPGEQGVPD